VFLIMKYLKYLTSFCFLLSIVAFNNHANAQEIGEELEEKSIIDEFKQGQDKILVGVREDAYPIAYREFGEWRGFCVNMSQKLSKYIERELNTNKSIDIEYITPSSKDIRFQLVKEKKVHLECGPNTIFNPQNSIYSEAIKNRYKDIEFSSSFFKTGTRLIVKSENKNRIKENLSLDSQYFRDNYDTNISVIQDTTTEILIKSIYPSYDKKSARQNRNDGFRAVMNNEALAFAADSLILEAALKRGKLGNRILDENQYILIPENSFLSHEFYGLVLHSSEQEWKEFINKFLETKEVKDLIKTELTSKYDNSDKFRTIQREIADGEILGKLLIQIAAILLGLFTIFIFTNILRLIYLRYKILKLEFGNEDEFNWNIFLESMSELKEVNPDLKVKNIKISEAENNTVSVDIKVPKGKNKTTFTQEFISLYQSKITSQNKVDLKTITVSTRLIWESLIRANVGEIVRRVWF